MVRKILAIVSFCLVSSAAVAGDQSDPADKCDANSTQEIVECLAAKTAQWDKRMTAAYQAALKGAEPQQHDLLRAAQRLWIQYRDANCKYYAMGEGSISRIEAGECLRSLTETRARELESIGRP